MKIIAKLSDMIEDEITGAKEYACYANKYKGIDNELAKMFYDLSEVEMSHMAMLHKQATRLINSEKIKGHEIPESMVDMYEMLHKQHHKEAVSVKLLQEEFKV